VERWESIESYHDASEPWVEEGVWERFAVDGPGSAIVTCSREMVGEGRGRRGGEEEEEEEGKDYDDRVQL